MGCQPLTLSGCAEWPKVADAVIEARQGLDNSGNIEALPHRDLVVRLCRPCPGIQHHTVCRDQECEVLRQGPSDAVLQWRGPLIELTQDEPGAARAGDNL